MRAKFKIEDIFYHTEKDLLLMIDNIERTEKGVLYTLKCLTSTFNENKGVEGEWKKYYEEKLDGLCRRLGSKEVARTLYAKLS